ncbi:MAG: Ig-like domain-containing protein, partial [Noviherbaspirillum sp.]
MKFGEIGSSFRNIVRYAAGGAFLLMLASCGGGGGSPGTVAGGSGSSVGSVSLIFSSPELKSAGTPGNEVTVTALVKNAQNNALQGVDVKFVADSGALSGVEAKSDKNGQAKAMLGTSGDRTNRTITVSVQAGGKSASGTVNVVGTTVTTAGPTAISAGSTGEFTITVKDSANAAVANAPVNYSSQRGNPIMVKNSGGGSSTVPLTNSQGQVVLVLTASQAGNDSLLISAQGATTTSSISVNA